MFLKKGVINEKTFKIGFSSVGIGFLIGSKLIASESRIGDHLTFL